MIPSGIPHASNATAVGVAMRDRPMSLADTGTAANEPTPAASMSNPTPPLPACRNRSDAMTAMASHIPRTKVRRPLATRMPVTWGSLTALTVSRMTARMPTEDPGSTDAARMRRNRNVTAAAPRKTIAAPAKTY